MALDLGPYSHIKRERPSKTLTVLQIIPANDRFPRGADMIALALCRTSRGQEFYGVTSAGLLFALPGYGA